MPAMSAIERAFCRSAPWRAFARRAIVPWALDGHRLAGDVLEVGAGSGAMAEGMFRAFPDINLTLTDLDPAMVDGARRRFADQAPVRVQQADATRLPFADRSFDTVTSFLMLHHLIQWPRAVASAARVLRPGGVLVGYDLVDTRLARWVHRLDGSPSRLIAPDELADCLAENGFTDISVWPSLAEHVMRFHATRADG